MTCITIYLSFGKLVNKLGQSIKTVIFNKILTIEYICNNFQCLISGYLGQLLKNDKKPL